MYKYILDKSPRKYACPRCTKKRFVRFINQFTGEYCNPNFGRCDREQSCGYFLAPDANEIISETSIQPTITKQTSFHENYLLTKFSANIYQNNFISYLYDNFETDIVSRVVNKYKIGSTNYWNGATIFWQIDQKQKIRGGKIMLYAHQTGKRVKTPFNHVSWMHKQLKINDYNLNQCLFGLHVIQCNTGCNTNCNTECSTISNTECNTNKDIICIVESEKTAIIMSIIFPKFIWLATASKSGFKEPMLLSVKCFRIIAYPDKSAFSSWQKVADDLNTKGYSIKCSKLLEESTINEGEDLVDYLASQFS